MEKIDKIVMYDSPEAAEEITLTGWVSKGDGSRFWHKDEHAARWQGCTHLKCECGNIMKKAWTKCDECRAKSSLERYMKLPFKEWDLSEPVCEYDGDKYFFNLEDLHEYMCENDIDEIDLLFCDPVDYRTIDYEDLAPETHEDWEPSDELEKKVEEFNKFIKTLPSHSWMPGKTRTSYKIPADIKKEYTDN